MKQSKKLAGVDIDKANLTGRQINLLKSFGHFTRESAAKGMKKFVRQAKGLLPSSDLSKLTSWANRFQQKVAA